jgi:anti-anti-sigma regulatory factor
MKFFLIVARGKHRGLPIPIEIDLFVIGSSRVCQLRADHPELGQQHCALVMRGRKVFVRDLGSGKPTVLNGEALPPSEEWPVHKGDRLTVGPLEFKISFHEKQLSQRDLEEWALRTLDEDTGPKKSAVQELAEAMGEDAAETDEAALAAGAILSRLQAQKGIVRGRLRISREGQVTVVRVNDVYLVEPAELNHLLKELHANLDAPHLRVLLDLKNVRRMSSAAVNLFAELSKWLQARGSSMAMCRLRPELANMLYDLQSVFNFKIYGDKPAALAARW